MAFVKHGEYQALLRDIFEAGLLNGSPLKGRVDDLLKIAEGNKKPPRAIYRAVDSRGRVHETTYQKDWQYAVVEYFWDEGGERKIWRGPRAGEWENVAPHERVDVTFHMRKERAEARAREIRKYHTYHEIRLVEVLPVEKVMP